MILTLTKPKAVETPQISDDELLELVERGAKEYRCGDYIYQLEAIQRQQIYQDLETERLREKHMRLVRFFELANKDWNQLLFIHLMHSISDPNNIGCYVEIAIRVGYNAIQRERGSRRDLEALLIATSGLLPLLPRDSFTIDMAKRGEHMLRKYSINPLSVKQWNRSNMTPPKNPIIRLSQIANFFINNDIPFNNIINCLTRDDVISLFNIEASEEWCRYFGHSKLHIGIQRCDLLGINFVVPMLLAYGLQISSDEVTSQANELNESIPVESNRYIRKWRERGLAPTISYESQALIQLAKRYCAMKRCAECPIYKHMCSKANVFHKIPRFLAGSAPELRGLTTSCD